MSKKYLISKDDFAKRFGPEQQTTAQKTQAWLSLAREILLNWDGRSAAAFIDPLTPGQFAIVILMKLHFGVANDYDLFSFIGYTIAIVKRVPKALEIVGADEYVAFWKAVAEKFPGGKLPESDSDVIGLMRMKKEMLKQIEDDGRVLATGNGMKRPMQEYVYDYVKNHPADFCDVNAG
jgi:hypothetical protein